MNFIENSKNSESRKSSKNFENTENSESTEKPQSIKNSESIEQSQSTEKFSKNLLNNFFRALEEDYEKIIKSSDQRLKRLKQIKSSDNQII